MRAIIVIALLGCTAALSQNKKKADSEWCEDGHVMPSVFMLGVQKAGSTSLWKDLRDSLPLEMPTAFEKQGEPLFMRKEPQFFSKTEIFNKGRGFYLSHFPKCDKVQEGGRAIDGTPNYFLGGDQVATRIKDFYGEKSKKLHFIIIVRDRVARMQAAFMHFMPNYNGGFDKYVEDTKGKAWAFAKDPSKPTPGFIWEGSMYTKSLKSYLQHFDKSQFSIVSLEQYKYSPEATMNFVASRTGLRKKKVSLEVQHVNHRAHPGVSPHTKGTLEAFFKDFDGDFEKMVTELEIGQGTDGADKRLFEIHESFDSGANVKEDSWGTYN